MSQLKTNCPEGRCVFLQWLFHCCSDLILCSLSISGVKCCKVQGSAWAAWEWFSCSCSCAICVQVLVPEICSLQECWRANSAEELQGNIIQEQSDFFSISICQNIYKCQDVWNNMYITARISGHSAALAAVSLLPCREEGVEGWRVSGRTCEMRKK